MKHIVFLEQYGSLGGGQQVLLELVRAALHIGFRATVLIPEGPCVDRLRALGAQVVVVPECRLSQGKKGIADIFRFAWYGSRTFLSHISLLRHADLIYVNGNRLSPVAMLAQLMLGRKAAYHIHLNHGGLERKLFLLALRLKSTRALVLPSEFIRRELLAADVRFDDPRVQVVPNGLDARFSDIPFQDRFTGRPLQHIGIVGRVSPEKGQDVLIPLAKHFPQLQFHVLGDAAFSSEDYYERLKREAPENVHFHGWVDDLPAKVNEIGLQVCLVPSRCPPESPERSFEAAPLVPLQMTALSCLVIVRKLGALEGVAKELRLETFEEDEEIEVILYKIQFLYTSKLAQICYDTYHTCFLQYSNYHFLGSLQILLKKNSEE
ncbi:glycosyltransferase family 4 protein [Desulfovibrio piger]|uniref:glycosyltransferase family 4 protein n=1 Tax=Desulfovibrio piger TaxID=901 RepID=UPI0026EE1417|nr:glycosyltransferase family 4 protein [Desulfovibrio piger]